MIQRDRETEKQRETETERNRSKFVQMKNIQPNTMKPEKSECMSQCVELRSLPQKKKPQNKKEAKWGGNRIRLLLFSWPNSHCWFLVVVCAMCFS